MNTMNSGKRTFAPTELRRVLELREVYRASGGVAGASLAHAARRYGVTVETLTKRVKESGVRI